MKKFITAFLICLFLASPAHAIVASKGFTALTGGTTGALDDLDGDLLNEGDIAFVETDGSMYTYWLDEDIALTEYSPYIISPDSNAGDKRWVLVTEGSKYYVNYGATDQGADGDDYSVKDLVDQIGTSKSATIVVKHWPANGSTTTYTFDTSETIPANIRLEIENGARFAQNTGDEVLTVYSPEHLIVGKRQQITAVAMLAFTTEGTAYPDWWATNTTPGTTDMIDAINFALAASEKVVLANQTHAVSESVIVRTYNILIGEGGHSALTGDFADSLIKTGVDTNSHYIKISRINMTGGDTVGSIGIDFRNVTTSIIGDQCMITNFETGIRLHSTGSTTDPAGGCTYNKIFAPRITSCATGILASTEAAATGKTTNGNSIYFPQISTSTDGIYASFIDSLNIYGGTIEVCTERGLEIVNSSNVNVFGTYFDFMTAYSISLDADCFRCYIFAPDFPGTIKFISDAAPDTVIIARGHNTQSGIKSSIGEDLVANGAFTANTTGWTATDATLASVAGGQSGNCLQITRTGGASQAAYDAVNVYDGRFYLLEAYVKSGTSGNETFRIKYGSQIVLTGTSSAAWVRYRAVFEAESSINDLSLQKISSTAGTMLFDTVSLTQIPLAAEGDIAQAGGTTGGMVAMVSEATATPTGTTTFFDIPVRIPSGAVLKSVQLRVDTALTAGETWSAAYYDGAGLQSIAAAGRTVTKNTKINKLYDPNADTPLTDAVTDVRITRDAGNFSDGVGVIRAIVYYDFYIPMEDAD